MLSLGCHAPLPIPAARFCLLRTVEKVGMVKNQVEYDASLWAERDAIREKRIEARLQKQAAQRGYKLVPLEAAA